MPSHTAQLIILASADPITALLTRDWAALGGWSLFFGFCIFAVLGAVREWWVPGARHQRLENSVESMREANNELRKQNSVLIEGNLIAKHFFEELANKKKAESE